MGTVEGSLLPVTGAQPLGLDSLCGRHRPAAPEGGPGAPPSSASATARPTSYLSFCPVGDPLLSPPALPCLREGQRQSAFLQAALQDCSDCCLAPSFLLGTCSVLG